MTYRILITTAFILIWNTSYSQEFQIDSTLLSFDSAIINGETYKAVYRTDDFLYIYNSKDSVVFKGKGYYLDFEFSDFNCDGYKDIIVNYLGNVPSTHDLILFDDVTRSFIPVENFTRYPDPKRIYETKYYYSYHRSGCADMNWDSDLFYINDFKVIKIGTISGRECNNDNIKDGIYIFKIKRTNNKLIKKLPIETINKFKDNKWGFINDYWTKNYKKF